MLLFLLPFFSLLSPLPVPPGSLEVEVESSVAPVAHLVLGVVVNSSTAALNLTCSVRETIRGLTSSPSAQWLGPVNGSYDDKDTITQYLNDSTVIITASFFPPLLIRAGMYRCVGTVQTSVGNVTTSENITVTYYCELNM